MYTEYAVTLSKFQFGDMLAEYLLAMETQTVGLRLYPAPMIGELVTRRDLLQTHEARLQPRSTPPMRAWQVEPLVQVKLMGDSVSGYSQGITMRNSETMSSLRYAGQEVKGNEKIEVVTTLRSDTVIKVKAPIRPSPSKNTGDQRAVQILIRRKPRRST